MRYAVPVAYEHLWRVGQPAQCLKEDRHLTEREQTWNVGEFGPAVNDRAILQLECPNINNHGRRRNTIRSNLVRHVQSAYGRRRLVCDRGQVKPLPKLFLGSDRTGHVERSGQSG